MTQPKRMHLSSYYPSCLFFFIFFFCFFPVGLFYSFVVVTAESASPQKNKTKKLFRMAQKWWMRCKNEQDMHHERQSNAHYCITTKTLFELQGHTKIYIYIYHIFGNDCATRHRWFVKTPSFNLVSYLGNAKCQGSLNAISVSFSRCDDRTAGKKKPNEKKQEEKRNQKNWGGGRPRAKLESRPTVSRCCLLLSKVCRVENVEKKK